MLTWINLLFLGLRLIWADATVVECTEGTVDCQFDDEGATCANNIGDYPGPDSQGAMMAVSTIFALFMAYGIGANDAANSWATSVGSGAVTLTRAVILCGFFEWLGATCLGSGVSSTIQKGVSDVDDPYCWACGYCNSETSVYMSGMMGALIGASIFLLLASLTSIPVSTTHAIVGGVVGMTMAGAGSDCLNWDIAGGLGGIVLSWVISPVFSGLLAVTGFGLSRTFIIRSKNPRFRALVLLPILFSLSTFILVLVTTLKAKAVKKRLELNEKYIISSCSAIAVGLFAFLVVTPHVNKTFPSLKGNVKLLEMQTKGNDTGKDTETQMEAGENVETPEQTNDVLEKDPDTIMLEKHLTANDDTIKSLSTPNDDTINNLPTHTVEQKDAIWVFRSLLVFNACLESFAHGSNDTANATGAFTAVYQMYTKGDKCENSDSDIWILSVAGLFVALGVSTLGYRVITTIGSKLTEIDFHKGFYIEFGSTIATIIATLEGFPVSTTHCQVGAVFAIGLYCKFTNTGTVNARLLLLIFGGWVITLPLAGGIAALVVTISRSALKQ